MNGRRFLYRMYWRLETALAPGLEYAQHHYERKLLATVESGSRWLDLGCGHELLPEWRREAERGLVARAGVLVGLDPEVRSLRQHRSIRYRVAGGADGLPFPDATFDVVTANMVVEHLHDPVSHFREIRRVLRPGGRFIFHTPNTKGHHTMLARIVPEALKSPAVRLLEGRADEDRFRVHYLANSVPAIDATAAAAGLEVQEVEFVATTAMFAMVLPLAALELLWIRLTMRSFPQHRANLLVTLARPATSPGGSR